MDLLEELKRYDGDLDRFAKSLPCILHINDPSDFSLLYIDPKTKAQLSIPDANAFKELSMVHPEDLPKAKESVSHYLTHIKDYSTVSFLQRIKFGSGEYHIFYTTSMLIEALGGLVSFSVEVDRALMQENQLDEIIDETRFIQDNFVKFKRLSKSELNFMRLWATNVSNEEIAKTLKISSNTIKTYKKRIYKKLEINSLYELHQYNSAFDFI